MEYRVRNSDLLNTHLEVLAIFVLSDSALVRSVEEVKRVMLLNLLSRFIVCQAALSRTVTACLPSEIFIEICSRCTRIASVFTAGITRPTASSMLGQTAPNI